MNSTATLKRPEENVSDIVNETKLLACKLRSAILHQDGLTKDCCDSTVTELSKTVEGIKNMFSKLDEEFIALKEQFKSAEFRLSETLEKYKAVKEENATSKEIEDTLLNKNNVTDKHRKIARELREKLKAYKQITGIRFDIYHPDNTITGYVGIRGNEPSNSTLVPFAIDKNNPELRQLLWEKISEACSDISDSI